MSWRRRLLPVPTNALKVDPAVARQSPKGYSQEQLRTIAATIPAVFQRMRDGATEQDFLSMQLSADPRERRTGETYAQIFRQASSNPISATYDGRDIVVDSGNHRVRAAAEVGIPVLPVYVSAASELQLDQVERACLRRIQREGGSADRDALLAHQRARAYEGGRVTEHARGEVREHDRRSPEFER